MSVLIFKTSDGLQKCMHQSEIPLYTCKYSNWGVNLYEKETCSEHIDRDSGQVLNVV